MASWLAVVWREWRTCNKEDPTHLLYAGVTAGVLGYLFHCTFENFFQWPVMAQSFWLLFGLSLVLAQPRRGAAPGAAAVSEGDAEA